MANLEYLSHPYYIFNYLLGLIYPFIKFIGVNTPSLASKDTWGFTREYSVITGMVTMIILRYLKYFTNTKKFINEAIFYLKLGNALTLFFIDIRLTCWYLFACTFVWIIFKQPVFNGPTRVFFISSKETFEEMLKYRNKLIKSADYYFFAVFYSNLNDNCQYTEEMWARMSIKYSTPCLNFIKLDVDLLPSIADHYRISNSFFSSQLPVILLFKNGLEIYRFPGYDSNGKTHAVKTYKEKEIIRLFDLERIHSESANIIPKTDKKNSN